MSLGQYRLLNQLGSGRDGVRYRAADRDDGTIVELILLNEAKADPLRWPVVERRLRKALMIDHPSSRKFLGIDLESDYGFVALEWLDGVGSLGSISTYKDPILRTIELAQALAAGHRFGLAHGGIESVQFRESGEFVLDWLGLEVGSTQYMIPAVEWSPADDILALGRQLASWSRSNAEPVAVLSSAAESLLSEMLSLEPGDRPTAKDVAYRLAAEVVSSRMTQLHDSSAVTETPVTLEFESGDFPIESSLPLVRERLGRFRLLDRLGEGGMGTVYRSEDLSDGSIVAIKVLKSALARRPDALRRFQKEARLLAEVNNPRVANLIEVNEDDGVHYLALEFVDGVNLAEWQRNQGTVDEPTALAIIDDVARALEAAHERGIVHRDIKPENILVVREDATKSRSKTPQSPRVKLSDFGLARHVVESESLALTRDGAIIGTPLYMSPEQCAGASLIGPPSDVYAMGATLFGLLAGRPPFQGDLPLIVMGKHQNEPVPDLKLLNPTVSDAVCSIVTKSLAKLPEQRYATAGDLLQDIERLIRGEPTGLDLHPRLPVCDPREIVSFDWRWDLEASPRKLWPLVSNTDRFNRAIGLNSVQFENFPDPSGGSTTSGKFRKSGLDFSWREHPFEWVEERRMGVVREFDRGPFEWFMSVVELAPRSPNGTNLRHQVKIKPRGLVGRTVAAFEIGTRGRKAIERVYQRIDAALTGKLGRDPTIDPFENPEPLSPDRRRRLERWLDALGSKGFDPMVVERLGDFLELAPPQEVARIRPIALARRLGVDAEVLVETCFRGAADGILMLLWDLLCPVCRIPSQVIGTLRALQGHGHCDSCRLDYELDFANSVEVIFRVHPEIRESDLGTYCAGSPSHSPHVTAQTRVASGERMVLDLSLETGSYRLRGPQLPYAIDFRVEPGVASKRWQVDLRSGDESDRPRTLRAGAQVIELVNPLDREILVRIERVAPRDDALTAARASSLAIFRELFPGEVLSPGQLINLATVTLLVTEIGQAGGIYQELGDARAFGILIDQFRLIEWIVRKQGGALIKTIQEGTESAFTDPSAAVKAALEILKALRLGEKTRQLAIKMGVHRGSVMVATLNDHLDYFGSTVSVASLLPGLAREGQIVLSRPVASDAEVAVFLNAAQLVTKVVEVDLDGLPDRFANVLEPEAD